MQIRTIQRYWMLQGAVILTNYVVCSYGVGVIWDNSLCCHIFFLLLTLVDVVNMHAVKIWAIIHYPVIQYAKFIAKMYLAERDATHTVCTTFYKLGKFLGHINDGNLRM